jgi:6-phosphogluconolactonase
MWAVVGSYGDEGGLSVFRLDLTTGALAAAGRADRALQAGHLVYDPATGTLYAVDERKTDGRGPVGPAGSVHAFGLDATNGALSWKGALRVPGPFPTFLDLASDRLFVAAHGSFDHVEQVERGADGVWTVAYHYDHSTVSVVRLGPDSAPAGLADCVVLLGHGQDPNGSPQAGGHAQASAHAHCATVDPSGRFLVVCDKGTDTILTFRIGDQLIEAARYSFPPETAPRHVAFSRDGRRIFVTLELASDLAAMTFDPETGTMTLIDRVSAAAGPVGRVNEPAEVRLHPNGRFVYLNNRGEDSLAWFAVANDGHLTRQGHVPLAPSIHPGLAARSFAFDPSGSLLLLADRPADKVRVFRIDAATGAPAEIATSDVPQPAFVTLVADLP